MYQFGQFPSDMREKLLTNKTTSYYVQQLFEWSTGCFSSNSLYLVASGRVWRRTPCIKWNLLTISNYVHDWICTTTYFGWMHVKNHLHTTKIGNDRDIYSRFESQNNFFSFQLKCEKENKQRHCLCSPPKSLTFMSLQQRYCEKIFTHLGLVYTLNITCICSHQ